MWAGVHERLRESAWLRSDLRNWFESDPDRPVRKSGE
jgi:hypothetical protein